jgi:hypothetical protein
LPTAGSFFFWQSTSNATKAASDPPLWCVSNYTNSVWYKYTAESDSFLIFDTAGDVTNYDTVVGVFSGSPGNLNALTCDNDSSAGDGATGGISMRGGVTYYIMIAKNGSAAPPGPAELKIVLTRRPLHDALALFNTNNQKASVISSLLNNPTPLFYKDFTNNGPRTGQWVMGDWNNDGVDTPGVYDGRIFSFTNDLGPTANWTDYWVGTFGHTTARPVVAGRFDPAFNNDCFGVLNNSTNPTTGDERFTLFFYCDMLNAPDPGDYGRQWLGAVLPDSDPRGLTGTHQVAMGDFDGDGFDTIAIRRGEFIQYHSTIPADGPAFGSKAQRWGTPSTSGEGFFVAGDWNSDGIDGWGVFYGNNQLYYRNDITTWNPGTYLTQQVENHAGTPRRPTTHRGGTNGLPVFTGPIILNGVAGVGIVGQYVPSTPVLEGQVRLKGVASGQLVDGGVGLPGDVIHWTATIDNSGTGQTELEAEITLPDGVRVDNVFVDGPSNVLLMGNRVQMTQATLLPGSAVTITIETTILSVPDEGQFHLHGTASGSRQNLSLATTVDVVNGLPETGYPPQ